MAKLCSPSARLASVVGELQLAHPPPSRRHSKLAPSSDAKAMLADAALVRAGGDDSIVVAGGSASTVQVRVAGVGSGFPAASMARTSKTWLPELSPDTLFGAAHGANAAPSTRLSKLASGSLENPKVALDPAVSPSAGPESIVVSGGSVSDGVTAAPAVHAPPMKRTLSTIAPEG